MAVKDETFPCGRIGLRTHNAMGEFVVEAARSIAEETVKERGRGAPSCWAGPPWPKPSRPWRG